MPHSHNFRRLFLVAPTVVKLVRGSVKRAFYGLKKDYQSHRSRLTPKEKNGSLGNRLLPATSGLYGVPA